MLASHWNDSERTGAVEKHCKTRDLWLNSFRLHYDRTAMAAKRSPQQSVVFDSRPAHQGTVALCRWTMSWFMVSHAVKYPLEGIRQFQKKNCDPLRINMGRKTLILRPILLNPSCFSCSKYPFLGLFPVKFQEIILLIGTSPVLISLPYLLEKVEDNFWKFPILALYFFLYNWRDVLYQIASS